jgi:hypothetical protein
MILFGFQPSFLLVETCGFRHHQIAVSQNGPGFFGHPAIPSQRMTSMSLKKGACVMKNDESMKMNITDWWLKVSTPQKNISQMG